MMLVRDRYGKMMMRALTDLDELMIADVRSSVSRLTVLMIDLLNFTG